MIIKSLTLCNYRNFYKKHIINFSPSKDKDRNIILIGGVNGAGKTTILEAFKVCLYSNKFNGKSCSKTAYSKFLTSIKNKDASRNGETDFYVELEIELDKSSQRSVLRLKRLWSLNNSSVSEKFFIEKDNKPLEIIPEEYWEDYIKSIIPPFISEYFFFDGEKVKELSYGDHAEKILYDAISDLTGLNLYKSLGDDIGNLIKKIKRRNIKSTDTLEKINIKEEKVKKNLLEIEELNKKIEKNIYKIENLKDRSSEIEKRLRRTAGVYAKNSNSYQVEIFDIKDSLKNIEEKIINICSEILPFVMASDLSSELVRQLEKEKKIKELMASKNILLDIKSDLKHRINRNKVIKKTNEDSFNILKKEIEETFTDMFEKINRGPNKGLLHDLTNSEISFIEDTIKKSKINISINLKKLLKSREEIIFKKNSVMEKISQIPDDGVVSKNIKILTSIQKNIGLLTEENKHLNDKVELLNGKINLLNTETNELEKLAVFAEKDNIKVDISNKIQNVINEFLKYVVRTKIQKLENDVTAMYKRLANKDDMVKEIRINKNNFKTMLIDFEGNVISKDSISAGEREIYALSILWGLSKLSDKELPMIIDSPLAKLDGMHRDNIITEFLPNASEQIIVLSHDKEIDNNSYLKLRPNINKVYTLTFSKEDKIKEGYLL